MTRSLSNLGKQRKALRAVRSAKHQEEVEYQGRRLAKLDIPLSKVQASLKPLDKMKAAILRAAYAEVREAEAQTFYRLFRAECDATGVDDMLRRFASVLRSAFHARSARVFLSDPPPMLRRPLYIDNRHLAKKWMLDARMLGPDRSYWSIPLASRSEIAGVIQFAFDKPYEWLPRELELLQAAGDRCAMAARRARLVETVRDLAGQTLHVEEQERRRISRELHDDAGQSLLFVRLQLELLERDAPEALRRRIAEIREITEQTILDVRRSIASLSPAVLDQFGLCAGLRELATRLTQVKPLKVRLNFPEKVERLPGQVELVAYRLAQECVQNIAKHSGASSIKISLETTDHLLELRIEDNGAGFDPAVAVLKTGAYGLNGMAQRAMLAGGSLQMRSRPGAGTSVHIRLPIPGSGKSKKREDSNSDHRRSHAVPAGN